MSHLSFEHFDPEIELGNLDDNGRPIRPKKKPGRKPNPPSPAQRKAQNRAAQRAFRERKRREMVEAEITVKRCMRARDQTLYENKRLKRRIEELTYESNYLKGYVLTLKMVCIANQVEVPKLWDTGIKDEIGAECLTFSKTKGIPQQLEFFLDKALNIITIDQHDRKEEKGPRSSSPMSTYIVDDPPERVRSHTPLSSSSESSYSSDNNEDEISVHSHKEDAVCENGTSFNDSTLSSIAPQLANHLESPFFQQLLNTDLVGSGSFDNIYGTTIDYSATSTQRDSKSSTCSGTSTGFPDIPYTEDPIIEEELVDSKTGLPRTTTLYDKDRDHHNTQKDKKLFPPMTPLDAIRKMRDIQHLETDTRVLFVPTELQRIVRHDTRIDVVPGAAMRDHMILFQDFYDANELFDYLAENSVFLGGELGNPDSWFVPPSFLKKYWFLCPNHKRQRMDNAVEIMVKLGKRLLELMSERKRMYIERDQYPDYFPPPTAEEVDNDYLARDDQEHLQDILNNANDMFPVDDDLMEDSLYTADSTMHDIHGLHDELDLMSIMNSMDSIPSEFTL